MVADAEVARSVLDVQYYSSARASTHAREMIAASSALPAQNVGKIQVPESVPVEISAAHHVVSSFDFSAVYAIVTGF